MATAAQVKAEFLKIWPLGVKCEHTHAREGFKLLEEMIEEYENRSLRHNTARHRLPGVFKSDGPTGQVGDPQ